MAGPIPRDCAEYDPAFENPWKPRPGETREQVLERARKVLADAGLPGGQGVPELAMDVPDSTTDDDHFLAWQRDVAEIGIRLKPYKTTWQGMTTRVDKGQAQIWGQAWFGDYPDAQNFLQLFYGPNKAPGPNGGNYANPEYDKLYESTLVDARRARSARSSTGRCSGSSWTTASGSSASVGSSTTSSSRGSTATARATSRSKYFKYCRVDAAERRADLAAWNRREPTIPLVFAGAFVVLLAGTIVAGRRANRGW